MLYITCMCLSFDDWEELEEHILKNHLISTG